MVNKKKILKPVPPNPTPQSDPILGHIFEDGHKKATERNSIAENQLQAAGHANKLLEHNVEATGRVISESKGIKKRLDGTHEVLKSKLDAIPENADKNTEDVTKKLDEVGDKIVDGLKPKSDIQKVQFVPHTTEEEEPEDDGEENLENAFAKSFFKLLRGKRGPKGDKPTDEELLALIHQTFDEMLPEMVAQAKQTPEEVLDLIRPFIGDVLNGSETEQHFVDLINAAFSPDRIKSIAQELIDKLPKAGKQFTMEEILTALKGELSYDDLKNLPNLDLFRRQASKTVALSEVTGITVSATEPLHPVEGDLWVDIS